MTNSRTRLGLALAVGVGLGLGLAGLHPAGKSLSAQASDRWGDYAVASGTIYQQSGQGLSGSTPQDAIYYLNYKTGVLLATIPTARPRAGGLDVLGQFAERDLVADFDLKPGETPHFLMTTASIASRGDGWEPLFVFESTTGQVATYRVVMTTTTNSTQPTFEMIERRSDPRLGRGHSRR